MVCSRSSELRNEAAFAGGTCYFVKDFGDDVTTNIKWNVGNNFSKKLQHFASAFSARPT